ncbi:MAG: ABC transporter permease [Cytophagales bacterium]|nr:ABC transporter permease [Cytophagales bacterium]
MWRNYLLIAWRNLKKNRVFSFINVFGLAIGMAACLLILQYVSHELSYDDFHAQGDRIYRVSQKAWNGARYVQDACGYNVAGPAMQADFPEVSDYAYLRLRDKCNLANGNVAFREDRVGVASAHFLTLFSFPLLHGNPATALVRPNTVVISRTRARRYFGAQNPVGRTLRYNDGYHHALLTVTGVMEDMPVHSHMHLDMVLSYETARTWEGWGMDWCCNNDYVYVLLAPGADPAGLAAKLPAFRRKYFSGTNQMMDVLELQPLRDIHLHSDKTFEMEANGSAEAVYLLLVVGLLVLGIAWVNYVNLATAKATERAKEVGIRKAVGSNRGQLVKQFMLEALLLNVLAAVGAFTLFQLALPLLDGLLGKPLSTYRPPWTYLAGWWLIFAAGAVVAGLYPALVLSRFQPMGALKGRLTGTKKGVALRKGLVVTQIAATVVLISGTLAVFGQLRFMQGRHLGMNIDQTLVVYGARTGGDGGADSLRQGQYERLKRQLAGLGTVKSTSATECLPGNGIYELNSNRNVRRADVANPPSGQYYNFEVDTDFFRTLEMKMLAGRSFSEDRTANARRQVVLNAEAVKRLGFASPQEAVGKRVLWGNAPLEVIGVVSNSHHHSLKSQYDPFVYVWDTTYEEAGYVVIKLDPVVVAADKLPATVAAVQRIWRDTFPNSPFDYFFLDERFNAQYRADQQLGVLFSGFAGLAILIACLGLYGLSLFATTQRTKEIGVRKVLGASGSSLFLLLSKDFLRLVLLAAVIACPVAYLGVQQWLAGYAFRIDASPWLFIAPAGLVLLITLLTVGVHIRKASRANPVHSLRSE